MLFEHQQSFLNRNPRKELLVWGTGTGKTATAILWAEKNGIACLVICPKGLKENWRREIVQFGERKSMNWIIMSKEDFRRDFKTVPVANAIIIDEIHFFSGMKSLMTKSLIAYTKRAKPQNILGLTASPFMANPWSVFVLAKHLGHDWNYWRFKQTFFYEIRMGGRFIPVMRKNIEGKVAEYVRKIGSVVNLDECVDVPDAVFVEEFFELTPEQEKAKKDILEILPIVRFTKYHQICGGTLKEAVGEYINSHKADRTVELAREHDKLIIVCRYNAELTMLKDRLAEYNVWLMNGETKDKDAIVQEFERADKGILIVNAACSEGWGAPSCNTMIFYSYDFSLKNYIQIMGRIQRINNIQKCTYISLVVGGEIDEDVFDSMKRKEDFHLQIYDRKRLYAKTLASA